MAFSRGLHLGRGGDPFPVLRSCRVGRVDSDTVVDDHGRTPEGCFTFVPNPEGVEMFPTGWDSYPTHVRRLSFVLVLSTSEL